MSEAGAADGDRMHRIAAVLESIAVLGRELSATRDTPFGDVRLTRSQLDALFLLTRAPAGLTPGALATALGLTPGAVTQLVDGLRSAALVEHVVNPRDARSRMLRLTPAATQRVAVFEAGVTERLAPRFDALSDAELDRLDRLLAKATDR